MAGHYHGPIQRSQNGYLLPAPGASVYVYQPGTTTRVALFFDSGLTQPIVQPVISDANANVDFYLATPQFVDLAVSGPGLVPTTIPNFWIEGPSATSTVPDGSITAPKLALLAVGTGAIQDLSVTTAKIAANAVTSAKVDGTVEIVANKNVASGYAGLNVSGVVAPAQLATSGIADSSHVLSGANTWVSKGGASAPWQWSPNLTPPAGVGDASGHLYIEETTLLTSFRAALIGPGATLSVDLRRNGVSLLTAPLALTGGAGWTAGTLAANPTSLLATDDLQMVVTAQAGSPTDLSTSAHGSKSTF